MTEVGARRVETAPVSGWRGKAALLYLGTFLLLALLADFLPLGFAPNDLDLDHIKQEPLQWQVYDPGQPFHWLGTDHMGRDLLANLIFGARTALLVSLPAMVLAMAFGILLGSMAGYWGNTGKTWSRARMLAAGAGWLLVGFGIPVLRLAYYRPGFWPLVGLGVLFWGGAYGLYRLLTRVLGKIKLLRLPMGLPVDFLVLKGAELVQAVPRLLLVLCLASFAPPSLAVVIGLSVLTYWPGITRLVRGEMIRLKALPFVEAGQALGFSTRRIIWRHALPNALPPLVVAFTFGLSNLMALESTLAFLGVGIPPDVPSWGRVITGIRLDFTAWWLVFFPGLLLVFTVQCLHVAGQYLVRKYSPGR